MQILLITYIFLMSLGLFYSFFNNRDKISYFFAFLMFFLFSVVARFSVVKIDMLTYTETMQYDFSSYVNLYYLREPVYWLLSKYLYDLIGDTRVVLVLIDVIFFTIILIAFYKKNIQTYFIFLFFCFFVSILGFQNVYRQYLATIFIVLTLFLVDVKFMKKSFLILFATLIHNVSILFFPLIFINEKKRNYVKLFFFGGGVFSFTYLLSGSKSNSDTGDVPPFIYLIFMSILFLFHIVINKMKFRGKDLVYFYFYLYSLALMFLCSFLLGSAQLKRVGMICLILSLFIVYDSIEKKFNGWSKIFTRVIFFILAVSPCLLSSTVRDFLLV